MGALSRVLLFGGAVLFAVVSALPWYTQSWGVERAWNGEESLAAVVAAVLAVVFAVARLGRRKMSLAFLELVASAAVAVCSYLYIDANSADIVIRGEVIPSGMGTAPYLGLATGVLMSLGSLLGLFSQPAAPKTSAPA